MTGPVCRYCGVALSNPRRVQCGEAECRRRFQSDRVAQWLAEHPGYRERFRSAGACADCGDEIRVRPERGNALCGACQRRRAAAAGARRVAEMARARRLPVRYDGPPLPPRSPKPVAVAAAAPMYVMGWCPECGAPFVDRQVRARFCSVACGRRAAKSRRRAAKRGAFVADVRRREVFERDRWTCHLCGQRVAWTKAVPHPRAPVLDHVVPLAAGVELGGVHAPYNVRTAHFLCNSLKRDLVVQPALF